MNVYKKIIAFLMVMIVGFGCFHMNVEAADKKDEDISTEETVSGEVENQIMEESTKLYIDNRNIYEGMDKSYSEGYVPRVIDGYAYLVLPLQCEKTLKKNIIRTSLNLGEGETIPFIAKNYEKDFTKDGCYLVSYALQLKEERYNGSYPVIVNVSAVDKAGSEIQQTFTVYVTITDGKIYGEEPVVEEEPPVFAPKVLVESYVFSKKDIKAGDEVTAEIVLVNTSKSRSIKNMTVTVTPADGIELVSKSDSVYVESVKGGDTFCVSYDFKIDVAANVGQYSLGLAMDYADYEGNTYTSTGAIKISVGSLVKMQFDPLVIPAEVEVGETLEATTQVMNLGRGKIYNVRADISAEGIRTSQTMFIGDVEAGAAVGGSAELFVEGLSGNSLYGNTEGTVTFYYEDEAGEEYSESLTFKTAIVSPLKDDLGMEEVDDTEQWWIIMAVIGIVLAVIVVILIVRKVKIRKNED